MFDTFGQDIDAMCFSGNNGTQLLNMIILLCAFFRALAL